MSLNNCEDDPDPVHDTSFKADMDICQQLMSRYSLSSAPHHRHLLASAAAINSLLKSDSQPLTPASYFSATINNLSNPAGSLDSTAIGALVSLLSIATPLIPKNGINCDVVRAAVSVLVSVVSDEMSEFKLGVACVRGTVECIGILTYKFCDLENWASIQEGFETLIKFSIDKRHKVRKSALKCVETVFHSFSSSSIIKTTSKFVFEAAARFLPMQDESLKSEQLKALYAISLVTCIAPYLSLKISLKFFTLFLQLLRPRFSPYTRNVMEAIEAFMPVLEEKAFISHCERMLDCFCSYISIKGNPIDTVKLCLTLLSLLVQKYPDQANSFLMENPSRVCNSVIDVGVMSGGESASVACDLLINLLDSCLDSNIEKRDNKFIVSLCGSIENTLTAHNGIPNSHLFKVISSILLKFRGDCGNLMTKIVLRLGDLRKKIDSSPSEISELDRCIGSAVSVMGPETVLEIFPISFCSKDYSCNNFWLVPILKEYVVGASLRYYMDHLLPLAKSLHKAGSKGKEYGIGRDLKIHAHAVWELLCSFCRQPNDLHQEADSLSELLITLLRKKSFKHLYVATALQNLIKSCILENDDAEKCIQTEDYLSYTPLVSKKTASKNLKALSLFSTKLLDALIQFYIISVPEKRLYVKDAIECVALITDSSASKKILSSLCNRFDQIIMNEKEEETNVSASEDFRPEDQNNNEQRSDNLPEKIDQRHLILDIASLLIKGANNDLVEFIYGIVLTSLRNNENGCHSDSYHVLSKVLQEHSWFCSSKLPELIDLVISTKPSSNLASIGNRLVCLRILMAHLLKGNIEDEDKKAFLILNVIISTLKDKCEETRKLAYNSLVTLSSTLKDASFADSDEPLCKLINMILAYLSTPSPHIKSGAISALSVLIFDDVDISSKLPHLIPSVLSLLSAKSVEIIKAVLGFVKVISSSLEADQLKSTLSDIVNGVLPWSSVSRNHFRSKVVVIMEILIRKCGYPYVESATPNQFKNFLKSVSQNRHHRPDNSSRLENKTDNGRKRKADERQKPTALKRTKVRGESAEKDRMKKDGMRKLGNRRDIKMKRDKNWKTGNKTDSTLKAKRPKKLGKSKNR